MKAVRTISLLVAALVATLALPAAARTSSDLVRLSGWSMALEVTGLAESDSAQVEGLWSEFVAGSPAHSACLVASPPRVVARADMAPRAAYAPASGTLYVKAGDVNRLVVFHELAHHLDFTCGAADAIGDELRVAQGISPSKAWWKEGAPVTWPAEYFANAVAISFGEQSHHGVAPATVAVVEEWMGRAPVLADAPQVQVLTIDDFDSTTPGIA